LLTFQKQSGLRAQSAGDSLAQSNQQTANQESALSRAMRDELSRSKKDLRLAQLESPYFISYQIREVQDVDISASSGSLLTSGENRSRMLTVELRVGDYALDNTNFFAGPGFAFTRNRSFFGFNELPLDDNYLEFRRVIWLATDSAYKQALETWQASMPLSRTARAPRTCRTLARKSTLGQATSCRPKSSNAPVRNRSCVTCRKSWVTSRTFTILQWLSAPAT
jgi:hypothetical protein